MPTVAEKRSTFRKLHESGCFVIPNPWDVGSARYLQGLGFKALATTSSGFAFSQGMADTGDLTKRDAVLAHFAQIAEAVDIPISADFQSGFAANAHDLAESVRRCIGTGVAGFSIEDSTGDASKPLYDLEEAVDRLRIVRKTIDDTGADVTLTARAECFLVGSADPLADAVRRLKAYAAEGADVLFAPGPKDRESIRAIVEAVSPKPVNIIMSAYSGLSVADLAELGVGRISVGSALARAAWTGFIEAAKKIAEEGSFECLDNLVSFSDLNAFFGP